MLPGACIVFNSVSPESYQLFVDGITAVGMKITHTTRIAIDEFNPILILKAE
jgi:precorrin-6Y C5,15-methyltransferase (decarboxylating)